MKIKQILIAAAAVVVLVSCGGGMSNKTTEQVSAPDKHTAATALDYTGRYVGTIPAADCPGIEVSLILNDNGTYDQHLKYLERSAEFDETGAYEVRDNVLILTPSDGEYCEYYKVEESRLLKLNADKQLPVGDLAERYILLKQNDK